ncbi:RagB/SusD family nutrient uptake outer membrane protein [Flavivirga eckloniae]|nr:RagB/SusD family nutrient uptake outer membrane protein [Flavivirga eckloniae]
MKKLKLITLTIACITSFYSCDETEFLTAENINSPDANKFVVDRNTAESTIFGIYSGLQFNGVCGGTAANTFEAMSVTSKAPHYDLNGGTGALNSLTFSSDGGVVLNSFRDLYQLIDRSNVSISSIEVLEPGIIREDIKLTLLGEARFLRALGYFWLVNTYEPGKLPLITEPATTLTSTQDNARNIKTTAEIYAQIEEDLLYAQKYLPYNTGDRTINEEGTEYIVREWTETYKGRATWGAATAYLGKAYLYQGMNDKAVTEFQKIVAGEGSGQYALVDNFGDNSNIDGEWNQESIFEVGFSQQPQVTAGNFGGGEGSTLNETTTRGYLFNWQKGGWGITHSSNFITELFKSDIVDENNPKNYKDGDINNKAPENFAGFSTRCNATIAFTADGAQYYDLDLTPGADVLGWTTSQSRIKKFTNWNLDREPAQAVSEINERLMRLADVYLMYAEALLKDRGDAGVAEAVEYINRVRSRAGVIDLETLFGTDRTYLAGPRNSNAVTNTTLPGVILGTRALNAQNILTHLYNEERILEFAFEGRGITWQDTNRRSDTGDWINFLNDIEYNTNGIVGEFDEAAKKLAANPQAGYFPIPAIEVLGSSSN